MVQTLQGRTNVFRRRCVFGTNVDKPNTRKPSECPRGIPYTK